VKCDTPFKDFPTVGRRDRVGSNKTQWRRYLQQPIINADKIQEKLHWYSFFYWLRGNWWWV